MDACTRGKKYFVNINTIRSTQKYNLNRLNCHANKMRVRFLGDGEACQMRIKHALAP